ncbi:extracellular solute-binding protein [Mesorhizobium sp. B292B1B]|uniref:extracellular solute-binding protein n=1 Tax=unclassified Mesorhizobium TaxID=325217 RepID=UPI0011267E83|nr:MULTISPECIES: extracellular solute-binding protein [unclassified Mesorhizobium]MCA0011782.1 extracellular solute-binding protein [Mesorhizobium sp. B294B1A1]MCA0038037.1 extracellular solute-binding protein [Mesorhizobium sp. B292B1B]TPM42592.1 extracellular solute-binding protein [Mesorhizobium sp. B2-3-2]
MTVRKLDDLTRRQIMQGMVAMAAFAVAGSRGALAQSANVTLPVISNKKFEGAKVIVESQSGPVISGPIQIFGPIWEKATGATIELVTYPFGQMFEKLRTELSSGAYTSDLINYQTTWGGDFMGGGLMEEVPEDVLKLVQADDIYPIFRKAMSFDGKTYGLAYDGNAHNLFYRRDLFENADYKKKFSDQHGYDLAPPDTWEQFYDVAKFFSSFDWSGTGKSYGFVEPMGRGTGGVYFLVGRGVSYSKKAGDPYVFFNPDDMSPRIAEPGWIQALEDWKKDLDAGPPGLAQYGFSESRPTFVSGQSAMITDWGDIGTLSYSEGSKVKGKTGTALTPGASKVYDRTAKDWIKPEGGSNHAPYLGVTAWLFGVPVTAENKEAAWDLAAFFCNPEASTKLVAFPDSGIQPSRAKTIQDPQPLIDAGMDPADAKQYLEAIGKAVGHPNAVLDLSIPGSGEYYNSLDVEASRFMAGEISAEQAMKNASDAWNQTTDRLGRDNQSKLYKAALAG